MTQWRNGWRRTWKIRWRWRKKKGRRWWDRSRWSKRWSNGMSCRKGTRSLRGVGRKVRWRRLVEMGCVGWGRRRARNRRGRVMSRVRREVHICGRRECEMDGICYQRGIVYVRVDGDREWRNTMEGVKEDVKGSGIQLNCRWMFQQRMEWEMEEIRNERELRGGKG